LQETLQKLKKQYHIIANNNNNFQSEIKIQKQRIIALEEMNSELYSQIVDLHRNYFIQNTPIDRTDCSYLS
jgi:hypothetical protein